MKKYNIIYADPPWDYGNTNNKDGQFWGMADKHYPCMKFKDICSLPIQNICEDNCYLFLWVTSPFLEKGFQVIKSWGFKYATVGFVWIKMKNDMSEFRKDGLGKYTISNAEYCLIARKGKYWRNAKNVQQIVEYPKTIHSAKPQEIRDRIVKLCGNLPRCELFAREKIDGWDSIGFDIDGKDIKNVLEMKLEKGINE
jgi:N6-adenosine-specific RNA methylase IME4